MSELSDSVRTDEDLVGKPAPDFTLRNQHGTPITLSSFRGVKNVVLVFFPFAFSRVCTGELCEIRDHREDLGSETTEILAVSVDHTIVLRAYADRDGYAFSLLSDYWPHGEVARAYGVFDDVVGCALRGTFIIDTAGVVRWSVQHGIPDARTFAEYAQVLDAL